MIRRKLAGTWRSTPWPLAAVLSATETGGGYLNAFRALAEALKRHGLPEPAQVSSDYFPGIKNAAAEVWPSAKLIHDIWHMRRNLLKNQRQATSKKRLRAEGLERCVQKKQKKQKSSKKPLPKLPPHLKHRPIWAFIRLLDYMAWLPTKAMFHIVAATVFARVRHVWGDGDFIDYFCDQYMVQIKEPEGSPSRCEWVWSARWWAGISSRAAMGQPPTQQPAESMNSKLKRDLRSLKPATTHSGIIENFARCVSQWSSPRTSDRSKKPMSLLGRECCSGVARNPSNWMLYQGKTVRRPFAKMLS